MELFKINFLILFFISSFFTIANAGEGPAFAYKIKMHKIEICDSTSTATACNGAVTIWDGGAAGSAYINIADTNAGATAASMGNIMLAEIGVEYTYFQITMDRSFKIKGYAEAGSKETCYTNANGSVNTAATGSTDSADMVEVTLMAGAEYGANNMDDEYDGMDSYNDSTPTGQTCADGDTHFRWREKIDKSLILDGTRIPTVKIAFGTSTAVTAAGNMGGDCGTNGDAVGLHANKPDITITFN